MIVSILMTALAVKSLVDTEISAKVENMPDRLQKFVKEHFEGTAISFAYVNRELTTRTYSIVFVDGRKVTFDRRGNYILIRTLNGNVPNVLPNKIAQYIIFNNSQQSIIEIERKKDNFEIVLTNGDVFYFDEYGDIISKETYNNL